MSLKQIRTMPSPELKATAIKRVDSCATPELEENANDPELQAQIDELVRSQDPTDLMNWYLRVRDTVFETPSMRQNPLASALLAEAKAALAQNEVKLHEEHFRYVATRTKQIDDWTSDFLDRHQFEDSIVVQLACGLDDRYSRVRAGRDVRWIDVDRPRVICLRERLRPRPEGDYEVIHALIGEPQDDESWLRSLPSELPVLIVIENLLYFLEPAKGVALLKRLLAHFRNGSIICDTFGSVSVTFTALNPLLNKGVKSPIRWGIDDAEDLLKLDSRLVLRHRIYSHDVMSEGRFTKGYPLMFGGLTPLISLLPKDEVTLGMLVPFGTMAGRRTSTFADTATRNSSKRMVNSFISSFEISTGRCPLPV